MKRYLLLLVLSLALVGCGKSVIKEGVAEIDSHSAPSTVVSVGGTPVSAITPTIVTVKNMKPGDEADYWIQISNSTAQVRKFKVTATIPDNVSLDKTSSDWGFVKATQDSLAWVTVVDGAPLVPAGKTVQVPVVLQIPPGIKVSDKKWEFWITVIEDGIGGNVVYSQNCRWLINMQ